MKTMETLVNASKDAFNQIKADWNDEKQEIVENIDYVLTKAGVEDKMLKAQAYVKSNAFIKKTFNSLVTAERQKETLEQE